MTLRTKAGIALLIAVLELALLPVLLDIGGTGIGVVQTMFLTFLIGTAISLPLSYSKDRFRGLFAISKSWMLLAIVAIAGILNYAIAQYLLSIGTLGTDPSIGGIVFRTWIIMLALLMPFFLKNKITKRQLAFVALGFVGLYPIITNGTVLNVSVAELPFILILLASAGAAALSNLLVRKYNVNNIELVTIFNCSSLIFSILLLLVTNSKLTFALPINAWIAVLFLGGVTYTFGSILYYYSFKTFNPIFVGNVSLVIPFLTICFSFLILGTQIQPYYIYSAAILSIAIYMQHTSTNKALEYIGSKPKTKSITIFDVTSAFANTKSSLVYNHLKLGHKALAIQIYNKVPYGYNSIFEAYGCFAFTNSDPHPEIKQEELDFINDILGGKANQLLIGVGKPENLEDALYEFTKKQ